MNRPIITAKVHNFKEKHWIDLYANGWRIASIWGAGEVIYCGDGSINLDNYRIDINGTDAFIYVDAIEQRKVEPIKQEVAGVSS